MNMEQFKPNINRPPDYYAVCDVQSDCIYVDIGGCIEDPHSVVGAIWAGDKTFLHIDGFTPYKVATVIIDNTSYYGYFDVKTLQDLKRTSSKNVMIIELIK